ncbi:hypothetical protein [Desulfovibrio inopinatus]|uniref:hypothetical protein n=1 Tax=Desulfovibrio inopinatus TaxID=102109 RepID=UPI0004809359|nr:hypothetical protein [Desulfovibrio inopinatus]
MRGKCVAALLLAVICCVVAEPGTPAGPVGPGLKSPNTRPPHISTPPRERDPFDDWFGYDDQDPECYPGYFTARCAYDRSRGHGAACSRH